MRGSDFKLLVGDSPLPSEGEVGWRLLRLLVYRTSGA